jgi:hypothetical protein
MQCLPTNTSAKIRYVAQYENTSLGIESNVLGANISIT